MSIKESKNTIDNSLITIIYALERPPVNLASHLLTHDPIRLHAGAADWKAAAAWRSAGLSEVVCHRGRDAHAAGQSCSEEDLGKFRRLASMGFARSITGGLTSEGLPLFAGRAIRDAADPAAATVRACKARIAELWS